VNDFSDDHYPDHFNQKISPVNPHL